MRLRSLSSRKLVNEARRPRQPCQTLSIHHRLNQCIVILYVILVCNFSSNLLGVHSATTEADNGPSNPTTSFRFRSSSPTLDLFAASSLTDSQPAASSRSNSLVWQPLPLRATFRPLNRGSTGNLNNGAGISSSQPPSPPTPPIPPSPPSPPVLPESLAITFENGASGGSSPLDQPVSLIQPSFPLPSRRSLASSATPFGSNSFISPSLTPSTPTSSSAASLASTTPSTSITPPPTTTTTTTTTSTTTTTPRPFRSESSDNGDDEAPTRQPLSRFRPTRAPADDEDFNSGSTGGAFGPTNNSASLSFAGPNGNSISGQPIIFGSQAPPSSMGSSSPLVVNNDYRITNECYECICEASTNCNAQSRCQTSDVRHTRCGMFLISYDQWLASGLSRDLVTREALARDAAADERAFYECVTKRDCAERLLAIYLEKNSKDCDKDGRIDCYDLAAIHHSGLDQCSSETLLDSQYWSDFNACFGFGRRR